MMIENNIFFKENNPMNLMITRNFYLYKLKYPSDFKLPDFSQKFPESKIKENILDISLSEDEKRKHLLVIVNKEGNFIYGLFYKLKPEREVNIVDEELGEITLNKLEEKKAVAERSRFILDLRHNLILGEYNNSGIRFFQTPLGEYLRASLGRKELEIEVVYDKESYEGLQDRDIKYFKIKIAKPKMTLMENIFGLSGLDVFEQADDSQSLFVELRVNAGRSKSFKQSFVKNTLEKFNAIRDKEGIKKFEVGQSNFDKPLELVKDKILRKEIDIQDKSDGEIFEEIVNIYQDLNLNELLDLEDDEDE